MRIFFVIFAIYLATPRPKWPTLLNAEFIRAELTPFKKPGDDTFWPNTATAAALFGLVGVDAE